MDEFQQVECSRIVCFPGDKYGDIECSMDDGEEFRTSYRIKIDPAVLKHVEMTGRGGLTFEASLKEGTRCFLEEEGDLLIVKK